MNTILEKTEAGLILFVRDASVPTEEIRQTMYGYTGLL